MSDETKVYDTAGVLLQPGTRVTMGYPNIEDYGVVVSISDPDGDVNDYGAAVAINPYVTVRFDSDGTEERLHTVVRGDMRSYYPHGDYEYECEDIDAAKVLPTGVWRRGPIDWAYRIEIEGYGSVYGCGFESRDEARERMKQVRREVLQNGSQEHHRTT